MEIRNEDLMRDGQFWTKAINNAGLKEKLLPFNDVVVGYEPGNGEPVVSDAVLDGIMVDIYHSDSNGGKGGRIYIHKKDHVPNTPDKTPFFGPNERDDDMHLEANERP